MDFEAKKKEYQGILVEEYRMLHKEETDGLTDEEVALMNPLSEADITMLIADELNKMNIRIVELVHDINFCDEKMKNPNTFHQEVMELRQDKIQAERELEDLRMFIDIGEGTITESETEDKDWINNWKQYWHTFTIGDLFIKPTWEPETEEMKGHAVLSIDPGTAFGTGSHETTRMVIKQLQKYVKDGDEVLDVGCGSGILSVVALKYGAKHAFGTDLDPNAIIASEENAEQNNIDKKQLEVIEGNIIDDKAVKDACGYECYDIVCANILADILEPLSTCIHEHMKHGAYFITSGIIDTKENEVAEAFKKNPELEIVEINHDGEWVNITARRK